jgi:hypothetical protein
MVSPALTTSERPVEAIEETVVVDQVLFGPAPSVPGPVIVAVIDSAAFVEFAAFRWVTIIEAAATVLEAARAAKTVASAVAVFVSPEATNTVENAAEAAVSSVAAVVTVKVIVCAAELRAPCAATGTAGVKRTTYVPATVGAAVPFADR